MAGHSKWSKIKRLKGALDVKRGKLFSRLSKEIAVAARLGGGNPSTNARLRASIQAARAQSMPNDNIERAIKKGTGDLASQAVEELVYEGYAPGGVALVIETATDNKNRTAADLRLILTKHHGNLGGPGSVAFQFHRRGLVTLPLVAATEDILLEALLDSPVEEIESDDEHHIITTPADQLYAVAETLRAAGLEPDSQKLTYLPQTTVAVSDEDTAQQVLRLCDALEDCDDVLAVHSNYEPSEETIAQQTITT